MKKAIISLSGGMDSTTVLAWLIQNGYQVRAVAFTYGSKHNGWENQAASDVAHHYNVPFTIFNLREIMGNFDSALLKSGGPIPEGHYTDASMAQTVVPGRNMIFLSLLAGMAWSDKASYVAIGIHQGDHAIYPDCRNEFFKAMDTAIYLGTDRRVEILAPFSETDKTGIVAWGHKHNVPYRLTRTCYKDQPMACGKCGSCQERLEAFRLNKLNDPVAYVSTDGGVKPGMLREIGGAK